MKQIREVVAASDLSAYARHAAARAAMLAADTGAHLTVAHIVNAGGLNTLRHLVDAGMGDVAERLLDEVRGEMRELVDDLGERHGAKVGLHLATGSVESELVSCADGLDADLLVLGARGASVVREWLLGSTTERVLRTTVRPMLVVKQMPHEPYQRVLVPVDFSARSVDALRLARAVAPKADLILLHAFEVPFEGKLRFAGVDADALSALRVTAKREAVDKMNALVAEAGLADAGVRRIVLHGDSAATILAQEQEQDCDLIVIGKRGLSVLESFLLGSVTKHILSQSAGDVLVADRSVD